jgi:hypothetical protein
MGYLLFKVNAMIVAASSDCINHINRNKYAIYQEWVCDRKAYKYKKVDSFYENTPFRLDEDPAQSW